MKTASGLTIMAIGAILAFAVTRQPFFINLHIAGWALMLTGVAGMLMPRRGYGWLRRRTIVRRGPRGQVARVEDQRYPPYIRLNPESPPLEPAALGGDTDEFSPANGGVGEPPTSSYTEVSSSGGYTEGHPPASAYSPEPAPEGGNRGSTFAAGNPSTVTGRPPRRRLWRPRQTPAEEMVEEVIEE